MFKAFRRYYWVSQGFLSRHSQIIYRTVVIVLSFVLLFFLFARYIPTAKHTERLGRVGKYNLENFPQDIHNQLSQGLVSVNSSGLVSPAIAQSWEVKDEGKTYVFTLNQSLHWHDGEPIKPLDIPYNFQNVEIQRGEGSITYHLQEPFAPFLTALAKPILKKNQYGTGDFRLTKTQLYGGVLQSLTLESATKRLIYKFYPTESSALTAYKLGEIDTIERLFFLPEDLKKDQTSVVGENNQDDNQLAVLFFNNNDTALSSKPTRQALAYAIEDKSFGKTRAISPIAKSSWVYNNLVKTYDYDAKHAQSLLSQDVQDPSSLKIELKTTLQYLDIAESIASSWRDSLGIGVDVKVISNTTSDYQVLLTDFSPPLDPDQYAIWHSTQATNFTHFSNLKIDKLLEDGRRTSDLKLRKDIYQDFQRFLLEDCPAVFLFKSTPYTVSRKPLL